MEWIITDITEGIVAGIVIAILVFPFWYFLITSRQNRKWEGWEEEHAWPLGEHAHIVTDRVIEAQKKLGREASPRAFQHYITEESGRAFPIELCQALLTAVAMQPRGQAKPPTVDTEVAIEKTAKAKPPTVGEERPRGRVHKGSPMITDVDKLITFGQMAVEQGWYDQAREYFEQAVALDASNREAMKGVARVYEILSSRGADDGHFV